jgi:hypothetical protein
MKCPVFFGMFQIVKNPRYTHRPEVTTCNIPFSPVTQRLLLHSPPMWPHEH